MKRGLRAFIEEIEARKRKQLFEEKYGGEKNANKKPTRTHRSVERPPR